MKKILYGSLFIIFISLSYCCAELNSEIEGRLGKVAEAMKEYAAAWKANYEEMSKYQQPYYTYDKSIFQGVAYVAGTDGNGNIGVIFLIKNNYKSSFDISKARYFGVDKDSNIFRFQFVNNVENEGIAGSPIINPKQEITYACLTPFKTVDDMQNIQEIYIKLDGKRVFFVPEEKIKEYSKLENRILRHLRNLWWNIR